MTNNLEDSKRGQKQMNKKKVCDEYLYLVTMKTAQKLLTQEIITIDEYRAFEAEMKQKYSPVMTVLFADIDLQ